MLLTENQTCTINILKGFLPFLVIAVHSVYAPNLMWNGGNGAFLKTVFSILGDGIPVPVFFIISGYFFFSNLSKWKWGIWFNKIRRRTRTLLVPYLLWCIIAAVATYLWICAKECGIPELSGLKDYFSNKGGVGIFYNRPYYSTGNNFLDYDVPNGVPIVPSLWYLRDLILMVMVSPIIWIMLKRFGRISLCCFGLLFVFNIGFPFQFFLPRSLFFFSLGAFFSINNQNFIDGLSCYGIRSLWLSMILFIPLIFIRNIYADVYHYMFCLWQFFAATGIISAIYSLVNAGKIHNIPLFSDSGFFVYVVHGICILEISNFILWHLLPYESLEVLKVFLRPILAYAICLLIFVIMRRLTPKTLGLLTGGRY